MTKHFCILLLAALLLVFSSCGVSADQLGSGEFDAASGAVAMICEKTELDRDTASELYRLVVKSGLVGELKYVTVWTDAENGEPYYRLRTNDGKREVYIEDGEIIRITDGDIVYYDQDADIATSSNTSREQTSTANNVSTEDMPSNTELEKPSTETKAETSPTESYAVTETEQTTVPHETEAEPPQTTPPVTHTYVLNNNSKKFHLPTCSSVKQIKDKNREEYTGDRETLIACGYSPCKRCNP